MRLKLFIILFLISGFAFSQEELANDYFSKGEFDKALAIYKKLEQDNIRNTNYKLKIIEILRQLEQLNEAETYLKSIITNNNNPVFLIELGYNYELNN